MITIELKGATAMVRDLKRMREKAIPCAIKNALNTAAFEARTIWQREIASTFTNRNSFTVRSVRVEQATTSKLQSKVGTVAPWLKTQEEGGTVRGGGKHKAIPMAAAAGQGAGGKRTKLVRSRFYLGAINVAHGGKGGRRQQNAIAIAVARKTGKNIALLTRPGGGRGLFLIGGGKRSLKTRMLWDVSRSSVRVKPEPTLERSLAKVKPKLKHMLEASMKQQLQRFSIGK